MPLLVTSAAGPNGDGYGALLAFGRDGRLLGNFTDDGRIADPRGLTVLRAEGLLLLNSGSDRVLALDPNGAVVRDSGAVEGLNPGGGNLDPDGRYYVGSRSARTVVAFSIALDARAERYLPSGVVPFPRGFAFGRDGTFFLASGIGPHRAGDDTILAFASGDSGRPVRLVTDPELSPLDLAVAPNGNIVVSSEQPFGAPDAVTTVREYDAADGRLVRVFAPHGAVELRRPRGLRFGPDERHYCAAEGRGRRLRLRERTVSGRRGAISSPARTGARILPIAKMGYRPCGSARSPYSIPE
jgi:DNA-binding beta-propeller fold protein YncE